MTSFALAALLVLGANSWEDGSLIVLENSNKPVADYTGSTITHLALLRFHGGNPWVYEATPSKVRRVAMATYIGELSKLNAQRTTQTKMWIFEPKTPYNISQLSYLQQYLNEQLGRRYSVKGYVRHRPGDGIHCAEFASTALSKTGRFRFDESYSLSPSRVVSKVKIVHEKPQRVVIPTHQSVQTWCSGAWERWFSFQAWCTWASYEALTFCR